MFGQEKLMEQASRLQKPSRFTKIWSPSTVKSPVFSAGSGGKALAEVHRNFF